MKKRNNKERKSVYLGCINPKFAILDIVFFHLDSSDHSRRDANQLLPVMILAIMIAVGVMMFAAKPIGDFVDTHPTLKILALAFLILVGVSLMAESLDIHIPKGYIYFAMGFSAVVEMLNIKMRKSLGH